MNAADGESEPNPRATSLFPNGDAADDALTPPPVERIIEALLFVGGSPLPIKKACSIIRGLTSEQFLAAVEGLNQQYRAQNRPYLIQCRGGGYELALQARFKRVVAKLYGGTREARLSNATVDVLALVAYRQPATKAEIDALRGADSGAILRQLVRRGLIGVAYRPDTNQPDTSYETTARFLQMFSLQSLDDLPQTQDLQQM